MRILAILGRAVADAIIWGFYGAFTIGVIGGITGVLHGVVFNIVPSLFGDASIANALISCCLSGFGGLGVGAFAGAIALTAASLYCSARDELSFAPRIEHDFMIQAAGATQAGFICSFAGASTGAMIGMVWWLMAQPPGWRITDAIGLGYVPGAVLGFTLGAFVGALVPQRVQYMREQIQNAWNRRRQWLPHNAEEKMP